jgi:hypothetical protein
MTLTNPERDMRARWRPSDQQMNLADALLRAGYDANRPRNRGVYTMHLLVNKQYGIWTDEVTLIHLDGVYLDRDAMYKALHDATERFHEETGATVTGGYTWHPRPGEWAVWDDIMSEFPK